jgi:hypothetical protein
MTEVRRILRLKKAPVADLQKDSYTQEEVAKMCDSQLLAEFTKLTGNHTLACKHCGHCTYPLERFIQSIRIRCTKKSQSGLCKDMKIPKTCDEQMKKNEERNKKENVIYNKYTRLLKNVMSPEEKAELLEQRAKELELKRNGK